MNLIHQLKFSYRNDHASYPLPFVLKDSFQLISAFFKNNTNNKLCLVFPTKEFAAQWLCIPTVLFLIESDYTQFKNEIVESLGKYKKGDRIILNNEAVVEWVGRNVNGFIFKHKEYNGVDEITISIKKISKIQPAPSNRKALSAYKRVMEALAKSNENPTDKILEIQTEGNKLFLKNSVCLISKHISFENSISEISINNFLIDEYFKQGKIDDTGEVDIKAPLLIANNFSNLYLYLDQERKEQISQWKITPIDNPDSNKTPLNWINPDIFYTQTNLKQIIIDSFSVIQERRVDFNDIDVKKIPTTLITDLSEIESFENIGNYGFDFFNFTKENLQLDEIKKLSPFSSFEEKLKKYVSFNLLKEICSNTELESITQLIHSIEKYDSVKELVNLKILLVQLTNLISRIAHPISESEIFLYKEMLSKIESQFFNNRFYLGGSVKAIEESLSLLETVVKKFAVIPSEKSAKLNELMKVNQYDYIICTTDDEVQALAFYINSLTHYRKPKVISVAEVNNTLLDNKPMKAILTGWAKSNNVNRILSSFLFSELTVLFYEFESRYFYSLQSRNKRFNSNVKSTINKKGLRAESKSESENSFADLYKSDSKSATDFDSNFDIADFELKLDNSQFSKYIVRGNLSDSVKAKRVEFKNDKFIYLADTHGLLVLENFFQPSNKSLYIHKSRIENLHHGDVIAFLKTERELLNKVVEKQTTPTDLAETNKWIDLWKNLLKNHYKLLNGGFNRLVKELEKQGCDRDPVTIRSWLFDDLRIGPRKDEDLIAIATMTNGIKLSDNIKEVRNAIRQMTRWRMKASDFVIEQLKAKIKSTHSSIQINTIIDFEDLGEVEILEITEIKNSHDNIDIRNINRLLEKAKL